MPRPRTKSKDLPPLSLAVKALRLRAGLTQQAFASKLGIALVSVARYETGREPTGKAISALYRLANEMNRHDLAKLFQERLATEISQESSRQLPQIYNLACEAEENLMNGEKEKALESLHKLITFTAEVMTGFTLEEE
jgi:transcriptional regulator with XRE-family HTH domain